MKKKIALALATIMSMSALVVSAADYTKVNLLVQGQAVETDQPAVIVDSRTMVPVRVVAETLGSKVDWDAETKTVTFEQDNMTAAMVVGDTKLTVVVDKVASEVAIDVPATIINKRTMVPIRFLSETFGCGVEWDAETKTVNVTTKTTDTVESGAAVEVTADDVQAVIDEINGYCTIINASDVKMTNEQNDAYFVECNKAATIASVMGTMEMDEESELVAAMEILEGAKTAIVELAGTLDISLAK